MAGHNQTKTLIEAISFRKRTRTGCSLVDIYIFSTLPFTGSYVTKQIKNLSEASTLVRLLG